LTEYLLSAPHVINVHESKESCGKLYISEASIQQKRGACAVDSESKCKVMRSCGSFLGEFDWKQNCFICGKPVVVRKPDKSTKWRSVQTLSIKDSVLNFYRRRQDQLAFVVQGRIETTGDLPAAEAIYHMNCCRDFSKIEKVQQKSEPSSSGRSAGRHVSQDMFENFNAMCDAIYYAVV
jgi:hypothetical protein